jgi:hypothetical protein
MTDVTIRDVIRPLDGMLVDHIARIRRLQAEIEARPPGESKGLIKVTDHQDPDGIIRWWEILPLLVEDEGADADGATDEA